MTFFSFTMLYVLALSCWELDFCEGVYGGKLATGQEVPWTILITSVIDQGIFEIDICSGTLVTLDLVLTASHCVQDDVAYKPALTLRAGVSFGSKLQVRSAAYCATRERTSRFKWGEFDFAVIKADKPFYEAYGVSPVKIATENFIPGTECVIAGHGRRPSSTDGGFNVVMFKQINIGCTTDATNCKKEDIIGPEPRVICPIAKEGQGVCKGDSGSGLVCNRLVYGVAHAIIYRRNNGTPDIPIDTQCGSSVVLSAYVGLWPYKDWIHKAIAKLDAMASSASSFDASPWFLFWNGTALTRLLRLLQPLLISTVLSSLLKA